MAFTVGDLQDLFRLLREKPEWREELRRAVLTEELLQLPQLMRALAAEVKALAEAQRRTEETVARLAERQEEMQGRLTRLEAAVEALAEAQRRTEARLTRLEAAVEALAEAQRRTEARLEALAEAQRRTEERLEALAEAQRRTEEELRRLAESQDRFQAAMERFQEAQDRFQRTQDRFSQVVGATAEARMTGAVRAWASARGWRLLDPIESLPLDSATEIDGVARVERPDGVFWVLASAKVRAGRGEVLDFVGQLTRQRVRELLRQEGIAGKALPVVFGLVGRKGGAEAAARHRVGLLLEEQGVVVEPEVWDL